MTNDKRQVALEAIKNDPRVAVILISFKAGSTGLNLTCCNNVILLDLWWYVAWKVLPEDPQSAHAEMSIRLGILRKYLYR